MLYGGQLFFIAISKPYLRPNWLFVMLVSFIWHQCQFEMVVGFVWLVFCPNWEWDVTITSQSLQVAAYTPQLLSVLSGQHKQWHQIHSLRYSVSFCSPGTIIFDNLVVLNVVLQMYTNKRSMGHIANLRNQLKSMIIWTKLWLYTCIL